MTDRETRRPSRLTFADSAFVMSRSAPSVHPPRIDGDKDDDEDDDEEEEGSEDEGEPEDRIHTQHASWISPTSPTAARRLHSGRTSELNLHSRLPPRLPLTERSSLLDFEGARNGSYTEPNTARSRFSRKPSLSSLKISRNHSRVNSWGVHLANALGTSRLADSKASLYTDERVWYDQFTSTDWVHDSIADAFRVRDLRARRDLRGRIYAWFDGAQGWILVAIIGMITACIAYFVNVTETSIFDLKEGFCKEGWYYSKRKCCFHDDECPEWKTWGAHLGLSGTHQHRMDFVFYVLLVMVFSIVSCLLTLITRTEIPSTFSLSTLDENLAAVKARQPNGINDLDQKDYNESESSTPDVPPPNMVYYPAAGSGVAEVKVILSGFVVHGYLGVQTLIVKTVGLIFSVASGLSLGKEGPYVHIATCVGNVACRLFSKYNHNDGKRREVLSASAASGVGVAFGAPIGGVLFSLEEVSYYFPPKTLFRTFFCCIVAALSLKFLNPYGTGKIVIFEVRYESDWRAFEIIVFVLLGILGGALGALFIKACRLWATTFRRIPLIKKWPLLEVVLVALLTGVVSFWNRYTKLAVTELLLELASPCDESNHSGLCPQEGGEILGIVWYLCAAFVVKAILTTVTFGIKVPAGIYVPSMVVGGLMGRIVGHLVQYLVFLYPDHAIFGTCSAGAGLEGCVTPGVYALVAAGATMCGVTRLSVTLAVILFELTGSLDHVLPFSLSVLVAKWTADALEPLSIYDLLTDMNNYPLLDNKIRPIFTDDLASITPTVRPHRLIDVSNSPLVSAPKLRRKLEMLRNAGEIDGGLPIIRHGVLIGLIPAPDLEFALDKLDDEEQSLCLMATNIAWQGREHIEDEDDDNEPNPDPTDFTPYIDPAPMALDVHSPMDLVFQCFVKLGLRYICVSRDGMYAGLVHKKTFVKYIKELEEAGGVEPA